MTRPSQYTEMCGERARRRDAIFIQFSNTFKLCTVWMCSHFGSGFVKIGFPFNRLSIASVEVGFAVIRAPSTEKFKHLALEFAGQKRLRIVWLTFR